MDTLHDRLAELADDAPTGGAPAAELWTRGKRAHRRRASAFAAGLLVVGALGAGIGVRLAEGSAGHADLAPARTVDISLPITYPAGEALPDLGDAPGPLAAIWLAPRGPYTLDDDLAELAPQAVGLVARTGTFGTLPIDLSPWLYESPDSHLALSPDGRRIAYSTPADEMVVLDLVTGDRLTPAFPFEIRAGGTWVDATHLVGHVAGGSDGDGWVWEPGTAPKRVNPYPYLEKARPDTVVDVLGGDPSWWSCESPRIRDGKGRAATSSRSDASVLCDDLGVIGSETLLGHLRSGAVHDPNQLGRAVVALDVRDRANFPFDDPGLRRVVVNPGAPNPVTFATDLLREALAAERRTP